MSGASPAFRFDPVSPSNTQGVDSGVSLGAAAVPAIASPGDSPGSCETRAIEQTAQTADDGWHDRLRELGQQITQVRQSREISLDRLHLLTRVPLHHLKALEMGRADLLPEPIYVRGFIRRIGSALGLDGDRLAASLPIAALEKSVVPSWKQPKPSLEVFLSPIYFYLSYVGLVVVALTVLLWLSHQGKPTLNSPRLTNNTVELNP